MLSFKSSQYIDCNIAIAKGGPIYSLFVGKSVHDWNAHI